MVFADGMPVAAVLLKTKARTGKSAREAGSMSGGESMMLAKVVGQLVYRFKLGPQSSDVPDHWLVDLATQLKPGRALDLGSGTGRNALHLARQGWDVTAVELSRPAVEIARSKADAAALTVRFVVGDVTRLAELGIGGGYQLLMDGACFHVLPRQRRRAYIESVTAVAAPGATLLIIGFTGSGRIGLTRDEILQFDGWRLVREGRVPGDQMSDYVSRPVLLRALLRRGHFRPMRYELERPPEGSSPRAAHVSNGVR